MAIERNLTEWLVISLARDQAQYGGAGAGGVINPGE
jgi:hypothetical protein